MNKPLISVLIPAFNCERFIRQSLESILNQTYHHLEVIVCDDASTDNTWRILCSYSDSRLKLYQNKENKGVVNTKNFLLSMSTGDYLAFQDADDWSECNRIEIQLKAFFSDPSLNACCTSYNRIDHKGNQTALISSGDAYLDFTNYNKIAFCPNSLLIRSSVYKQVGGLHAFFSGLHGEDMYWLSRIISGNKCLFLNMPLYYYRFNENSITNTFDNNNKLVAIELIEQLILQRATEGTDWLERNDKDAIDGFIKTKLNNKKWLAEKYRIFAAVQRDGRKNKISRELIFRALRLNPWNAMTYRTLAYILLSRSHK